LDKGVDVNTLDKSSESDNRSALLYAAEFGNKQMVEMLLERGANPQSESGIGESALCIPLDHNDDQVVKLLFSVP
jgi:ankyrin repeat protein